jgi:hypothetical protein
MSDTYEQIVSLTPELLARRWPSKDAARVWLGRRGVRPDAQKRMLGCILIVGSDGLRLDPITQDAVDVAEGPMRVSGGEMDAMRAELLSDPNVRIGSAVMADAIAEGASDIFPALVDEAPPDADDEAPTIEEPVMPKAEASAVDPTEGLLVRDAIISIEGLPASSRAYGYARDLCRKLRLPVMVRSSTGDPICTVTRDAIAAAKRAEKAPRKARAGKEQPEGKRLQVVNLCLRPEGATVKELVELTGWHKAPWKWMLGKNSKGTGFCDRYGYEFSQSDRDGATCYHLHRRLVEHAA